MKSIILAAGYATRLGALTRDFPKPLLPIGGSTILSRLMADIDTIADITEHVIVTNHKFADIFRRWLADGHFARPVRLIDDGSTTNDNRLGAVCDLLLAISHDGSCKDNRDNVLTTDCTDCTDCDDDLLVLSADNLLDFSLRGFVEYFKAKGTSVIMCHEEPSVERLQRTGVITVDDAMRVLDMQEKPAVPASHWAVPPFYIYAKRDMPLIRQALADGCGHDAPGNLAHYLARHTPLHAWPMPAARHDIGSLDSYEEAKKLYGA